MEKAQMLNDVLAILVAIICILLLAVFVLTLSIKLIKYLTRLFYDPEVYSMLVIAVSHEDPFVKTETLDQNIDIDNPGDLLEWICETKSVDPESVDEILVVAYDEVTNHYLRSEGDFGLDSEEEESEDEDLEDGDFPDEE